MAYTMRIMGEVSGKTVSPFSPDGQGQTAAPKGKTPLARRLLIGGVALMAMGGLGAWQMAHPPLSDAQQVARDLEQLRAAVEGRDARGILGQMAPRFAWNNVDKKTLKENLAGVLYRWREVKLQFGRVKTSIKGDTATTSGRYALSFKPAPEAEADKHSGAFGLKWRKVDGDWQIEHAEGGAEIAGVE